MDVEGYPVDPEGYRLSSSTGERVQKVERALKLCGLERWKRKRDNKKKHGGGSRSGSGGRKPRLGRDGRSN